MPRLARAIAVGCAHHITQRGDNRQDVFFVDYTQYINRFHRRSGHLWQGRFYSCALDGRHLWLALKYVELNPVRAKLCRRAWQYPWSTAALHVDEKAGEFRGHHT